MLIVTGCFIGVLSLCLGLYWLFVLRPETQADRALSRRLVPTRRTAGVERTSLVNAVAPTSTLPQLERALLRFAGAVRPLERLIERSGFAVTLGQVLLGSAFAAVLGAFAGMQVSSAPLMAVGAGVFCASAPFVFLKHAANRRMAKFEEQFPEA